MTESIGGKLYMGQGACTLQLVLDEVVERLKQVDQDVGVVRRRVQVPQAAERLKQRQQLGRRELVDCLEIRRHVVDH
jgi:hypothetical protein